MGLIDKPAPATGIPVNQPYPAGPQYMAPVNQPPVAPGPAGVWSSSLCGCFGDLPSCCLTLCCPCITFGRVAEIVDKGNSSCGIAGGLYALLMALTGCQCIYSCTYRTKMRKQFGIEGSECGDCCTHFCCECCALAQMSRELTSRGYDVSLGWDGNVQNQNQGVNMAPVASGGMYR